jgi:hypothetical protein
MSQAESIQKDIAQVFQITQGSVSNDSWAKIWSSQENHS